MGPGDLLARTTKTLRIGGAETLRSPPIFRCSQQTHEPFRVLPEPFRSADVSEYLIHGLVRTNGGQFDGDRTDVHDIFSLIWAAVLRTFGLSSPWLIAEEHFVPGEIGACHLLLLQCPWGISEEGFEDARKAMNAWSAFAFHLLDDVFRWERVRNFDPDVDISTSDGEPMWAPALAKYLRSPKDITINRRVFPLWIYFASLKRGVSVIRMPRIRIMFLKRLLLPYVPSITRGERAFSVFASGIANVVPFTMVDKAKRILDIIGDRSSELITLPIESHCLFISDKTIVAIRGDCGLRAFQEERKAFLDRRYREDHVFFADASIKWKVPINAEKFEALCLDLIRREPGVAWAKPIGGLNDRDGGRDIMVEWVVPKIHDASSNKAVADGPSWIKPGGAKTARILVQVKSRSRSVGKRDVQDIRDTIEHHGADGFLLMAHPHISASLVDHLEGLRREGKLIVDWLETSDIEDRLRRHPDIAHRYPELLSLEVRT